MVSRSLPQSPRELVPAVNGVERTLRTLLRSANPAASDLLAIALGSDEPALRVGAVRTLALRDDAAGHRTLVEKLLRLPPDAQAALVETPHRAPLAASLVEMIKPATPRLARRGAELASDWRTTLVLPAVAEAVLWAEGEDRAFYVAETLRMTCLLEQAIRDYQASAAVEGGDRPEDPAFQRRAAVNALAKGLAQYERHGQPEIVNAFLRLAPSDEPALTEALRDTDHPAHPALLEMLRHSDSEGALGVLASALLDPSAPEELLLVATERSDSRGLAILLTRLGYPIGSRARSAAARIPGFAWLEEHRLEVLVSLPEQAQAAAVQLAAASGASRKLLAKAIELMLQQGAPAGRLAAAVAIESLKDRRAHPALNAALLSDDPSVLATVAKWIRPKDFPEGTAVLILLLEHEDRRVVEAAQRALEELTFVQFRDQLGELAHEQRRRLGRLIAKADPNAAPTLTADLRSGVPERRLRTLELIDLMGLAGDLAPVLIQRALEDPDAGVRAEAVALLGGVPKLPSVLEALEEALADKSSAVRNAAKASFERLLGQPLTAAEAT